MSVEPLSPHATEAAVGLLQQLGEASGRLTLIHPDQSASDVWVREGKIYAAAIPGYRPNFGIRLLSGGIISPAEFRSAAFAHRAAPNMEFREILVQLGLIDSAVVSAFIDDQLLDQIADLMDLPIEGSEFHCEQHPGAAEAGGFAIAELLSEVHIRRELRLEILENLGGIEFAPKRAGVPAAPDQLGPYDQALFCRIDGHRTVTELARLCGYTVHETAQIVSDLMSLGLLESPPTLMPDPPLVAAQPVLEPEIAELAADQVGDLLAQFSAFVREDLDNPPVVGTTESRVEKSVGVTQSDASTKTDHAVEREPVTAVAESVEAPSESPKLPAPRLPHPAIPGPVEESSDPSDPGGSETSAFMRELSSLSDNPEAAEAAAARVIVPIVSTHHKRRFPVALPFGRRR